jgi:uridylate kinase
MLRIHEIFMWFSPVSCVAVDAEVVLKATNVDGVYNSDPRKNENAALLNHVWYQEVALKNLLVMDITAVTLCQEN